MNKRFDEVVRKISPVAKGLGLTDEEIEALVTVYFEPTAEVRAEMLQYAVTKIREAE